MVVKIIIFVIGVFNLLVGSIYLLKPKLAVKSLKFFNKFGGIKTEVTKETLVSIKIRAILGILLGAIFIYLALSSNFNFK